MPAPVRPKPRPSLTAFQLQVLAHAAAGYQVEDTAAELCVSTKAVHKQRTRLIDRLGAVNIANAVALAYERGLLPLREVGE